MDATRCDNSGSRLEFVVRAWNFGLEQGHWNFGPDVDLAFYVYYNKLEQITKKKGTTVMGLCANDSRILLYDPGTYALFTILLNRLSFSPNVLSYYCDKKYICFRSF